MDRRGFTLIEVMVVVVIMGLIAAGAVWSMAGNARERAQADALEVVDYVDQMARAAALSLGRGCVLRFDLDRQRVVRLRADGEVDGVSTGLGGAYRVDRVLVASGTGDGATVADESMRVVDAGSGAVDVAFSSSGRSATYALRFVADGSDKGRWLVLAGVTGQATVIDGESEIDNLFSMLAGQGPDAD
jgi:prepilin-type N-terminal cleavage/methylation domain-containing protein